MTAGPTSEASDHDPDPDQDSDATEQAPEDEGSIRPQDLDARDGDAGPAGEEGSRSGMQHVLSLIRESVQLIVVALLLAFVIKSIAVQAFFIPSGSMLETLQIGDRVLVEKISYRFREPQRGEIIVFRRPGLEEEGFSVANTWRSFLEGIGLSEPDPDRDLIKRIIALPGETVELVDGVVHINGVPLEESYTSPETRDFPPVTVPDGEYYVLGDNRGNSLDSRFGLGTVPEENVVGRSLAIIWPVSQATFDMDADYPGVGETPVPAGD